MENERTVMGMAEYIERDSAAAFAYECGAVYVSNRLSNKNAFPSADVAPVVHAEWLDIVFDPIWRSMKATCSHCMVRGEVRVKSNECGFAVPDSDFCPSCGAKMDL